MSLSPAALGVAAMIGCCTFWGLSPLYYKLLSHVPPTEVLAHRTVWSCVFFGLVVAAQGRMAQVWQVLADPTTRIWIAAAALMISVNWFLFIFAVQSGQTVESSLGYYIYPLMAVVMGRLVFGERLSRPKWIAVTLAAIAVSLLAAGLGAAPWIALVLAATFTLYGALKKRVVAGPVISVSSEVVLLVPFAALWLWLGVPGGGAIVNSSWGDVGLLALSGVLTGLPLILFSYASKRLQMASVGLIGYLNPTLQFLCATLAFGEAVTIWHVICFGLIWSGLALYSYDALSVSRRASTPAPISAAK